jgi:hypothetical protein
MAANPSFKQGDAGVNPHPLGKLLGIGFVGFQEVVDVSLIDVVDPHVNVGWSGENASG